MRHIISSVLILSFLIASCGKDKSNLYHCQIREIGYDYEGAIIKDETRYEFRQLTKNQLRDISGKHNLGMDDSFDIYPGMIVRHELTIKCTPD